MRLVQGWVGDLPLEVAHPGNGDFVVLQHLDITIDYRASEHDRIIVQELPYELRHYIRVAYLEDQSLRCHRELQDGGMLPLL
jgi:hypothetical protein